MSVPIVLVGTFDELLQMGYAGNTGTRRILPELRNMGEVPDGSSWNRHGANFKLEGTSNPNINQGRGIINTGLGRGPALDLFNDSILEWERVR